MIVEDGSGILNANSYVDINFVDAYATARGRIAWTDITVDATKEAAIIAATDYMENRFGWRFLGQRKYNYQKRAKATFTMNTQPTTGDVVEIAGVTFAFEPFASHYDSLYELSLLINAAGYGTEFGYALSLIVYAPMEGPEGDTIEVSTTSAAASWNFETLVGGNFEGQTQALHFPRINLINKEGYPIYGIPKRLKEANAEYAIRALAGPLAPDPLLGPGGQIVSRVMEKLGPIEEEYSYLRGTLEKMGSYPAADSMLREFLSGNQGGVYV